ncbi:P-loop containing nucleoside triphosphate hydrolase protein [Pholiota molesta]|nr:P-loop containing nucleoside triphosphate hydrolase protein [Pholiota molesta]
MAANDIDDQLNQILQKTQSPSDYKLLPDEITCLTSVFLTKSDASRHRSKAYVVLSALCQGVRDVKGKGKAPDDATKLIKLGETEETPLLQGITFLTALFQVDAQAASTIFSDEGLLENLADTVDISPSALLSQEVAHLLGQACGHKNCRGIITPQIVRWLEFKSRQSDDIVLQSAASVALIKLSKGAATDAPENATPEVRSGQADELAERMAAIITSGQTASAVDTIEGLAYLSTEPTVKETLAKNPTFLKHLFALVPTHKTGKSTDPADMNPALVYGIVLIICNLTNFRPRLTEEQRQMEKLKRMAKAGKGLEDDSNANSSLDDDDHVKSRIRLLITAGVVSLFPAAIAASDSPGIRNNVGKSILNIVEEKENRGKVLQAGGAKVLQNIIKQALSTQPAGTKSKDANVSTADLDTIQALAKLAITAAPVQVFGPNVGMMYDTIRPFSILLQHPSSNLLQRFEAIMALTNLASHSADMASRIAKSDGLMDKVELLLLEEHVLVRRASIELICNLIAGSDDIFERYSGDTPSSASKIHVLLALSDVDDLPTRLASSGALATVTAAPSACKALIALQFEKHRFLELMTQLIDPSCLPKRDTTEDGEQPLETDAGLVHRGVAISKKAGKKVAPAAKKSGGQAKVAKADWKEGFKKKQVGVSDMTLLSTISNESINDNLQVRWKNGEIYTYIGAVLISVNPFKDLGIYTDEILKRYQGKNRLEVPPHVFGIAESAYYNMNAYHENQCVIISGESGAGKTEAAKRIMQYIAAVSGGQDSSIQEIKDMVLATNPLLESFGCAKTLRNNNSSRHGKYLEIMFNDRGEPVGAQITNYLLEKGRVVGQVENERNFHIFYQFTKAASDEQREAFGLQGPEAYAYTSMSNCLSVSDIDDTKDFHDTINAMEVIGLTAEEQHEIFKMLAIVLWLGNVQFEEQDDGNSSIADTGVTDFVAYLMDVDGGQVQKVLTQRVMETTRGGRRGSIYDVPLNPAQATSGRDALAKAVYNNLFEWIVSRVNVSMKTRSAHSQIIGILDIFGFEIFEDNSFEQLCINYVNEKLQQIFIELTLKTEQEEYEREQIKWTPIKYFDNKIVCDLIEERRPPGIFAALNDACATAHADPTAADNSFMQRASGLASNPHFEPRGSQFLVRHYAGDVMYNVAGMTDKNKDSLIKDLLDLVASSTNPFLQTLFPDRVDPNSKKRPPTAGDRIKQSAGALVDNLMKAQPSYIRTIKPNQNRSSSEYDTKAILHQIKYLGLQENIRVRRAGFAYRNTFEKMVERFYLLSPNTSYAGEYTWNGDPKSGCQQILKDTGIAKEEWQMGVTKAFIKNPETLFALETMRDRYWHNMAARIQRAFRNYLRYKHECARRIQRFWKNNKEGIVYSQIRDYGHQLLAGRKERRRFSLLSYRRFMGDYLDINGKSALGEELAEAAGIGGENVIFSSRIQMLVSKFGRSSKPSPRFLILTAKALYILVLTDKNGATQYAMDRKIALVTIKSIGMSTLRDDWLVINGSASEEGDPIISCIFKTEFVTHLVKATNSNVNILITPVVDYSKKKDKRAQIKFIKDETVPRNDLYKSHTVHVPSGEPPDSLSRPPAKRKPGVVRPITSGKLLKAGGPSKTPTKPKPKPAAQPLPGRTSTTASKPAAASYTPAASTPATASTIKAKTPPAPPRQNAPPPPPPPPPRAPEVPLYRAKFAFDGQEGEMSLKKDDIVELVEKDNNGWWLVKKDGEEGWAPNNYLELAPPQHEPAAPPPPPRKPPPPKAAPIQSASVADVHAKPVSVFPGMAAGNGTAAPWKKTASATTANSTPASSRPSSSLAGKPPPPVANKPKPPIVGAKPAVAPKVGGAKPAIPSAPRPTPAASAPGRAAKPATPAGQVDLAAALAKRAQMMGGQ